jgi:hypothetical protein
LTVQLLGTFGGVSPAAHQGYNQSNILAVVANGDQFRLYVNKQPIITVTDTTFSQGLFALERKCQQMRQKGRILS